MSEDVFHDSLPFVHAIGNNSDPPFRQAIAKRVDTLPVIRYSGIPISRTSRGNANWFEKSGVREIEGGIKLRLIGRVLFDYE